MGKYLLVQYFIFATLGCSIKPEPSIFSDDHDFLIRPHIVNRADSFILRYQIDSKSEKQKPLLRLLCSRIIGDSGFYYLSAPTSYSDYGEIVEHSLSKDGFLGFARNNNVFWLNPDNSVVQLKIIPFEKDSLAQTQRFQ